MIWTFVTVKLENRKFEPIPIVIINWSEQKSYKVAVYHNYEKVPSRLTVKCTSVHLLIL